MISFIDFDNCLFKTQKLIDQCRDAALRMGIPNEKYTLSLDLFSSASFESGQTYDFEKHILTLKSLIKFNDRALLEEWRAIVTPELLFDGARELLTSIPGKKHLLTYGDVGFQTMKVTQTELWELFDKHLMIGDTHEDKSERIKKELQNTEEETIFFLEDRQEYLESTKKILPSIQTILISHKEGRYHYDTREGADHIATSLPQAKEIILNSVAV